MANSNPVFKFEEAQRIKLKASIMIEGLTGTGKTGLALMLSYYLSGMAWEKVFHIDTENKSANLFADIPFSTGAKVGKFKVGQLTEDVGYKPSNYLAFRDAAIKAGAEVVIEDSISHAWQYKGGLLDLVNAATTKGGRSDKYAAWRDEEVSAEKNRLLELIRCPQVHVITTVRVKEKFDYAEVDGKNKLVSLGEQQIQQADLKYEPDLVLHMVSPGEGVNIYPRALVVKSRYTILQKDQEYDFTPELCMQLKTYLEDGADPQVLLEQQRQDYLDAIKTYLDAHPNKVPIWKVMKKDAGYETTELKDIDLNGCKQLYLTLTSE